MAKKPAATNNAATSNRKNGKPSKKNPKTGLEGITGRTVGGYSPAKLAIRASKRTPQEAAHRAAMASAGKKVSDD